MINAFLQVGSQQNIFLDTTLKENAFLSIHYDFGIVLKLLNYISIWWDSFLHIFNRKIHYINDIENHKHPDKVRLAISHRKGENLITGKKLWLDAKSVKKYYCSHFI